jgi:hypothetical protein
MAYACLGSPYRPDGAAVGGGTGWWAGRRGPSGRACCGGEDGSGREGHAAQPVQREQEPAGPWPARGQVQVEAARGAGEPAGQGQERVRRVLVVIKVSPRPIRLVQRARLWAMTARVSQAALAANFPRGQVVEPDAVLEVADGVLHLGVAAVVGLQPQGGALAVGGLGHVGAVVQPVGDGVQVCVLRDCGKWQRGPPWRLSRFPEKLRWRSPPEACRVVGVGQPPSRSTRRGPPC